MTSNELNFVEKCRNDVLCIELGWSVGITRSAKNYGGIDRDDM